MHKPFPVSASLKVLVEAIQKAKGTPIAVGGCVRDHLLGFAPKDIDVEVFGLSMAQLEPVLVGIGKVHAVGRSFGVLKVLVGDETFDVSLPRLENKEGRGHKGFVVDTKTTLSFAEASSRRDFTINAMGINLLSQELLDPQGGMADLKAGVLRHVSAAFGEDPLRVLRGCQFAARFDYTLAPETLALCQSLRDELSTLPKERIAVEMRKLLLGKKPSRGLEALKETHALSLFEELAALQGCEQDPQWHPEGDVWVHTLMVTDEAAGIVRAEKLDDDDALVIMLGALCHDLGKPPTTRFEDGRMRSKGHEAAGEAPTRALLLKMGFNEALADQVVPLVREHLKPHQLYRTQDEISDATIRRLAQRVSIRKLCMVSKADFLGRTTPDALSGHDPATTWLCAYAERLQVARQGPQALLQGRHLLEAGFEPGPAMGRLLKEAFEAQLEGQFTDLEGALKWLQKRQLTE